MSISPTSHRRSQRADERGAAAVEFALILVPLLLLVFGIMQYGWYFYSMQAGTSATGAAARQISVGDCQDNASLNSLVASRLSSATSSPSSVQITVVYKDSAVGNQVIAAPGVVGGDVEVTVQFDSADFNLPFVPLPNGGTVTRTAVARVEDTIETAGGCR